MSFPTSADQIWPDFNSWQGKKFHSSPQCPYLLSSGNRRLFGGGGGKADHSPPSNAEIKEGGAMPPLFHTYSWPGI